MAMARQADPAPYDFRRPNKFNREHVRALQFSCETFARQFTTVLSTTLRAVSNVQHSKVDQCTYDEFLRRIPNPSYLAILNLEPLSGASVFHFPLPMMMAAVDRLLGGADLSHQPNRPLTEIEAALIRSLFERILRELQYAFEPLTPLRPTLLQQETNPQFAQVATAADMVITLTFDVRIGSRQGEATLCIPFASLQPVLEAVTNEARHAGQIAADPEAVKEALSQHLDGVPVELQVRFREVRMQSGDIVGLRPGDVLPLMHRVGTPLEVQVAGVTCFYAQPGKRGKRLACVVVEPEAEALR